ncbi:hypothetical protein EJ08DRAFT_233760 [Tothia fuscella]|uniref:Uncharacterized protein n=1 Tax=Tothia fuscella TaxID=1048955 RepID=A0A9P4P2P5_9PEZI|nr:hypothetical protein EJ08DRAFT_233760 [Tothia fuscella]
MSNNQQEASTRSSTRASWSADPELKPLTKIVPDEVARSDSVHPRKPTTSPSSSNEVEAVQGKAPVPQTTTQDPVMPTKGFVAADLPAMDRQVSDLVSAGTQDEDSDEEGNATRFTPDQITPPRAKYPLPRASPKAPGEDKKHTANLMATALDAPTMNTAMLGGDTPPPFEPGPVSNAIHAAVGKAKDAVGAANQAVHDVAASDAVQNVVHSDAVQHALQTTSDAVKTVVDAGANLVKDLPIIGSPAAKKDTTGANTCQCTGADSCHCKDSCQCKDKADPTGVPGIAGKTEPAQENVDCVITRTTASVPAVRHVDEEKDQDRETGKPKKEKFRIEE